MKPASTSVPITPAFGPKCSAKFGVFEPLLLAMQVTEQPKDDYEYDNRGEYSAAEFPRNKPGQASARWTFHSDCSFVRYPSLSKRY